MIYNAKHDYAEFYPEDFPWDGAFVIRNIQRKDWWPYRPVEGKGDALWLLGDDSKPDGLFGRLMETWGKELGWFIAGTSRYKAGTEPSSWTTQHKAPTTTTCNNTTPPTSPRFPTPTGPESTQHHKVH